MKKQTKKVEVRRPVVQVVGKDMWKITWGKHVLWSAKISVDGDAHWLNIDDEDL